MNRNAGEGWGEGERCRHREACVLRKPSHSRGGSVIMGLLDPESKHWVVALITASVYDIHPLKLPRRARKMPIYEYECGACGHQLEAFQKISEAPLTECPECRRPALGKLISATSFQLKGTGWYVTDFRDKGKPKPVTSDSSSTSTSSDTSSSSDTSASKSTDTPTKKAD